MNLREIRQNFVKLSGRLDLVNEYGYDSGADFFINSGIRLLNSLTGDNLKTNAYELDNDADECYWSTEHPDVLIHAALQRLEVSYRNTKGATDWLTTIMADLINLDKEWVEEAVADLDKMEG